jgi:predicted GIY-YIG superfamily endonuclease
MMATMYFVYIIRTLDDTLYIGVSERLGQRINSHKSGKGESGLKPILVRVVSMPSLTRRSAPHGGVRPN